MKLSLFDATMFQGVSDFSIEIGLGVEGNNVSVIRYPWEMGNLFTQQTRRLLHCNEYRTFWLKWGFDIIAVSLMNTLNLCLNPNIKIM